MRTVRGREETFPSDAVHEDIICVIERVPVDDEKVEQLRFRIIPDSTRRRTSPYLILFPVPDYLSYLVVPERVPAVTHLVPPRGGTGNVVKDQHPIGSTGENRPVGQAGNGTVQIVRFFREAVYAFQQFNALGDHQAIVRAEPYIPALVLENTPYNSILDAVYIPALQVISKQPRIRTEKNTVS